ncbi:ead/Ea22-like family protein [Escherichia coli]|uniref:ead/Ea22-like family protein n=1 Tax=Escherichia coli TaxID=562 RepID=UPI000BE1F69A|nr:ead/Ea22-like family protein [Escherichia coli]SPW66836.1 phage protein [Escherichia coli]HAI3349337.1 ead/Ea22-like family protein [Escherichia coli]HAL6635575.1 ead/Ea22-like family protein [Escherichia coli]
MREVNYEALREAAQNYQSTLAWYQAIPDSPNAERDCDAALAAFKRHIRHREADIIADLLDELEAREVQLPTRYDLRYGHPINADERHVMIPKENGSWLYLIDLEHALRVSGIRIKGEEHGNKTRG